MGKDIIDLTAGSDVGSPDASCSWNDEMLFFGDDTTPVKNKGGASPKKSNRPLLPPATAAAASIQQPGNVKARKRPRNGVSTDHQTCSRSTMDPTNSEGQQVHERPAKYQKPATAPQGQAKPSAQHPQIVQGQQQQPTAARNLKSPPRPGSLSKQTVHHDSAPAAGTSFVLEDASAQQANSSKEKKHHKKNKSTKRKQAQQKQQRQSEPYQNRHHNQQQQQPSRYHEQQQRRHKQDPRRAAPDQNDGLYVRRMELNRFAEAQAKRQRSLDAKEVALEHRARELESAQHRRHDDSKPSSSDTGAAKQVAGLEATIAQLRAQLVQMQEDQDLMVASVQTEANFVNESGKPKATPPPEKVGSNTEQQQPPANQSSEIPTKEEEILQWKRAAEAEIEASRAKSNDQIKKRIADIRKERESFDRHTVNAKQELETLKKESEELLAQQNTALQSQRDEFQALMAAERETLENQKTQFEGDVLSFRQMQQDKERELSEQELAVREQSKQLELREAEHSARAAEWEAMKAKINTAHQLREEELGRQEASLARVRRDVAKANDEVYCERKSLDQETREFKETKVKQQRRMEAWVVDIENQSKSRGDALDKREESLKQQKEELDRRAATLQRRGLDLKQMKKDIDELKKKDFAEQSPLQEDPCRKSTQSSNSNKSVGPGINPSSQGFVMIDDPAPQEEDRKSSVPNAKERPRRPPRNMKSLDETKRFSSVLTREEAEARQEKMFQEAAKKMKTTKAARVVSSRDTFVPRPCLKFSTATPDIATKYPDHWKWKEPYSCLGLPLNASNALVKAHFRILAKIYHPDKSTRAGTETKFNAVMAAYRKITVGT